MRIRPRLAIAILGFTVPFLINCLLIGTTVFMMLHDQNPLLIVSCITLSLCVTLVVIKASFHLMTELAGPLETGPARRMTVKDLNVDNQEVVPIGSRVASRSASFPTRPTTPVPPSFLQNPPNATEVDDNENENEISQVEEPSDVGEIVPNS